MKTLLMILFIFSFSSLVHAQISLTHEDVLNLRGTYETFQEDIMPYPFAVDVGPAGENQTWRFTDVSFGINMIIEASLSS